MVVYSVVYGINLSQSKVGGVRVEYPETIHRQRDDKLPPARGNCSAAVEAEIKHRQKEHKLL